MAENNNNMIKDDFPILKNIAYLDSTATTQKPKQVIEAIKNYYETANANIHRGIYKLSEESTRLYEESRKSVAKFINANKDEIVFTRNTTESLNLLAYSLSQRLKPGDEILISITEHHANLLPWQQIATKHGAKLIYFGVKKDSFELDLEDFKSKLNKNTKIVSISHISNVLGYINPVKNIISTAKKVNAITIIDGAQAAPHIEIDVKNLDCDFYAFSGHKMMGPMGIGVLYGKHKLLEELPPFMFGGDMIVKVDKDSCILAPAPQKFEAGTPNVVGAVGLKAAIDYLAKIRSEANLLDKEKELFKYMIENLKKIPEIIMYGTELKNKIPLMIFNVKNIHPHDIATILDEHDVAIRAGNHCAHPLHTFLGINASCRASLYYYNTKEDVDKLVTGLKDAIKTFG